MRPPRSLTLRLTLLFAGVSTSVLLLLGLLIGQLVERHFEALDLMLLEGRLALVSHALQQTGSPAALNGLEAQLDAALIGQHGLAVMVIGPDDALVYRHGEVDFPATLLRRPPPDSAVPQLWTTADGREFRGIAAATATGMAQRPPALVAVATDTVHHAHFMRSFQLALWSVVLVAALLSGVLGWLAARRGLAPLEAIRQRAADITATRLDQRLASEAMPPELAEVTHTLDAMLARLQLSFQQLTDFSSDIAHELRTPVSNLLTQTQVTLSRARTAADYREVLASNAEELERLSRMIADMLFLAKADNALIVPHREPVELAAEARDLIEFYEALAEERSITVELHGAACVSGDRLMLRRAIGNLLSNALRHTPAGGHVAITIADHGTTGATLTVSNTGETIAAQHLPRLFDRFYRVDAARQRLADGAGLGLAITRSIMQAHGGTAAAHSADGETAFELRFPAPPGDGTA